MVTTTNMPQNLTIVSELFNYLTAFYVKMVHTRCQ